jgi:hypothetical protein
MEQISFNPAANMGSARGPRASRGIIITAITLFALSGLLLGFTAGALTRPKQTQTGSHNNDGLQPVTLQTKTTQAAPTATTAQIKLGCPLITADNNTLQANNTVNYTLNVQAADKSAACLQGKPVHETGITCKAWLIKASDDPKELPVDRLLDVAHLGQPLPHEVVSGLTFDPTTPQVQSCNAKGQGTWKYGVASFVDKGHYRLMVLTDWQGKFYNWSWVDITVNKGDN